MTTIKKIVFSRTIKPLSIQIGTKHFWATGFQICSYKGSSPFSRGDNTEIAKIYTRCLGKFLMHVWGGGAPELLFHHPSLPRCMKSLVHLVSWMYYLLSCAYNVPSRTWMYDFVTLSSTYDRERRKNDLVCRMYDLICRMCDLVCRMDDLVSHAYVRCQSSILTKKWSNYNAWNCENMPINVEIKNKYLVTSQ